MTVTIEQNGIFYPIDLSAPLDISIPLRGDAQNVAAWGLAHPRLTPYSDGDFVGKVSKGASVNFNDIQFNPHAHGTHTECVGHITEEFHSLNQNMDRYFFMAELISVAPELRNDDWVISKHILEVALKDAKLMGRTAPKAPNAPPVPTALVIRTLPNDRTKLTRQYSGTNPPYLLKEAAGYLVEIGVEHLLTDLPSIDREEDDGALEAHKTFWNFDGTLRKKATITELIYVPSGIADGTYFLNLQVAAFENDASPSRPVLYRIME